MRKEKTSQLVQLAIVTAISIVLGMFISIPTPTGFLTLLDAGIFFAAFYFGKKEGAVVGALAGFLIDLLKGYPNWMFFSLLIHGTQGYLAGLPGRRRLLGLISATLVMVLGYAIASGLMYGWGAVLPDIPGSIMQNMVGMVVGFALNKSLERVKK
ncbi:TPA: ECF transporter S component [Streptococcus agalactiae]|nr:ECF transporter S component [Streptococcus agalactiae]